MTSSGPGVARARQVAAQEPATIVSDGGGRDAELSVARRRPHVDAVVVLALVVVAASIAVRLAFLGTQSYWTDEAFSVGQAAGGVHHALEVGLTEVHTPFYALVLAGWIAIGGTHTLWTHALSAVFGLLAILATFTELRGVGLSTAARWTAVAATAASGFGILYSQETRPYALVLLGATGLVATANQAFLAVWRGPDLARMPWLRLLAWALLTATAHLLGGVLVGVLLVLLVAAALRRGRLRPALLLAAGGLIAMAPQLAWLAYGRSRAGFASGTLWIQSPHLADVKRLVTTIFSSGQLTVRADGFSWASRAGALVVLAIAVVAFVTRVVRRPAAQGSRAAAEVPGDGAGRPRDGELALFQLTVAAVTVLLTYVVAQSVHIWTLRNMIVVVPSLTWGVVWGCLALPRTARVTRLVACALLVAMAGSLVTTGLAIREPYKTDWRHGILDLARIRAEHPEATLTFFGDPPSGLYVAADRGLHDPYLDRIGDKVKIYKRVAPAGVRVRRIPGPQAVLYYTGAAGKAQELVARRLLGQLRDPGCRRLPVHGLVLIYCP